MSQYHSPAMPEGIIEVRNSIYSPDANTSNADSRRLEGGVRIDDRYAADIAVVNNSK